MEYNPRPLAVGLRWTEFDTLAPDDASASPDVSGYGPTPAAHRCNMLSSTGGRWCTAGLKPIVGKLL